MTSDALAMISRLSPLVFTACTIEVAGPTQGFVGIGTGHTTPDNLLDVLGGDIDLETATRSYMIRDSSVLWHKSNSVVQIS